MELLDPPVICETWDTPYIYHPDDICDVHLPDGAYIDEEGNIVYPEGGGEPVDNGGTEPDAGDGE